MRVFFRVFDHIVVGTNHRVRFPRPRLTVRHDTTIDVFEQTIHQRGRDFAVDGGLGRFG